MKPMNKKIINKIAGLLLPLIFLLTIFLPKSLADSSKTFTLKIDIPIRSVEESENIRSSRRQVAYFKLKDDIEDENKRLELARSLEGKSLEEIEKTYKVKGKLSEESRLYENDKPIDNLTYKEYSDNKNNICERIFIKNLAAGTYLIVETKASKEGQKEKLVTNVVHLSDKLVDKDTGMIKINAKEKLKVPKKSIRLIKTDADNKDLRLDKFEFALYKKGTNGKADSQVKTRGEKGVYFYDEEKGNLSPLITWEHGELRVENLPDGEYYFVETKAIGEYDNKFNVNKKSDVVKVGGIVTMTNIKRLLKKVDDQGKPLNDAIFKLYHENGELVKFSKNEKDQYVYDKNGKLDLVATRDSGSIYVKNLPDGEYYFMEEKAPKGHYIEDKTVKYRFKYKKGKMYIEGDQSFLAIKNPRIHTDEEPKGGYNFVKTDDSAEAKRLMGAVFKVQKVVDNSYEDVIRDDKIYTVTSSQTGEFSVDGLEKGSYVLREIQAPENYTPTSEPIAFTVDGASKAQPAIFIKNKKSNIPPPPPQEPPAPPTTTPPTPTTVYTPPDVPKIIRGPLVKTGDIRIVIMAVVGILMIGLGSRLVYVGDRKNKLRG